MNTVAHTQTHRQRDADVCDTNDWTRSRPCGHFTRCPQRSIATSLITTIVIPAGTCGQASGANDLIRVDEA